MPPVLALVAVLAALVQRWRCACGPALAAEAIVLIASLGLAAVGLLATLLAAAGWFSGPAFFFTAVALAVLIWPWGQRAPPSDVRPAWGRGLALAALLALAAALRWPPIPADLGGRDQGTYVLRARHTLRTGRLDFTDPVLARAGEAAGQRPGPGDILGLYPIDSAPERAGRYEGAYRPGFYLAQRSTGAVVPQFLHLHPSLMSLFGLVFGPGAIGLVAPLAGVLAALALWSLAAQLWPRRPWSWLCAGLFALSPIAVWTDRTPLTEPLYGLFALAAGLAAARGLRRGDDPGLLVALLLGAAGFVRGNLWLAAPALLAVAWLRPAPGRRRMSAPTCLVGLLLASLALHLATTYPYLHDEFHRQLGPLAGASPLAALLLGGLALAAYLGLDAALAPWRGRLARAPQVLAALAALAVLAYLALRAPDPPHSRLDPALPLLGAPLLLAAAAGLAALARVRPPASDGAAWALAVATLPVTALALYAQRNLPQVVLYYYGRYLVPELLPAACLLAALALDRLHAHLSARTGLARHARWVSLAAALGLLAAQALPYVRAPATRLQEFAGAARLVDALAAELPDRAVVIAGGEGWHAAHTFNQVGGALAIGHGRTVLPYRGREAAYAALHELLIAGPAARGEAPPPVFLLLGEAPPPQRLPGAPAPLAVYDDLLPPPLRATPVALAELYDHRLTPVADRIPDRLTRESLRVALLAVTVDPARRAAVRTWRLADGVASGPGPMTLSSYTLREGQVCLAPDHPLALTLPPGEGPGSLVLVAHPDSAAHTWRVALDGAAAALDPPGAATRTRDTLGPLPFLAPPRRVEVWGSPRPRPDRPCPHGGLAELRLLGPDQGGDRDPARAWTRTFAPPDDLGHTITPARWTPGRALSRGRPGLAPADELDGPSVVVRPGRPLTFPIEHVPNAGELLVTATLRARALSPSGRLRLRSGDAVIAELDPPDGGDGPWQAPPQRWRPPGPAVQLTVELLDPDHPDAHVAVRDVALLTPPPAGD